MMNRVWISLRDGGQPGRKAEARATHADFGLVESNAQTAGQTTAEFVANGYSRAEFTCAEGTFTLLDIPGMGLTETVGAPELPRGTIWIALPKNAEYAGHSHVQGRPKEERLLHPVRPAPEPCLEPEEEKFVPNQEYYGKDAFFPASPLEFRGVEERYGAQVAVFFVAPLQYNPVRKTLSAIPRIEITVHYTVRNDLPDGGGPARTMVRDRMAADDILGLPCSGDRENADDIMLIIATRATVDKMLPLMKARGKCKPNLLALEDILPNGATDAKLKAYLLSWRKKGVNLRHVVLCGDGVQIPFHREPFDESGTIGVSDSWYCRETDDGMPLFSISRIPISDPQEMATYVARVVDYPGRPINHRSDTVFVTQGGENGAFLACTDGIVAEIQEKNIFAVTRLGPPDDKQATINRLNEGVGFANYRGHGEPDGWCASNGIRVSDIDKLRVGENTPHYFSIACSTAAIAKTPPCLGTALVMAGQAATFLGSSTPSYRSVNNLFNKFLWEVVQEQRITVIGEIFLEATRRLLKNSTSAATQRNVRFYLMLGDGTMDHAETVVPPLKIELAQHTTDEQSTQSEFSNRL